MTSILIVYATDYGSTEKMALAAAEGVSTVTDATVVVKMADEVTADDFLVSDGVILGSPVHMGSIDWRIKKMIDTVCSGLWMQDKMIGKTAAVFVSGGGYGNGGGGAELTMLSMLNNFAELGMIIVPLPKNTPNYKKGGLQWGPYGRSADEDMEHQGVSDETLQLSKQHAIHLTRVATTIKDNSLFSQ